MIINVVASITSKCVKMLYLLLLILSIFRSVTSHDKEGTGFSPLKKLFQFSLPVSKNTSTDKIPSSLSRRGLTGPQADSHTRILLVGDSVDRWAIDDWCDYNACSLEFATKDDPMRPNKGQEPFDILRYKAWEPRVCRCAQRQLVIGLLFNKYGTSCCGYPWHAPHEMDVGLTPGLINHDLNMKDMWTALEQPGLKLVVDMMGGSPHLVGISSIFWDIATYSDIKKHEKLSISPDQFIANWQERVKELVSNIKAEFASISPPPRYIWRMANLFTPVANSRSWILPENLGFITKINGYMKSNYSTVGVDEAEPVMVTATNHRDNVHPNPCYSIAYIEKLMQRTDAILGRKTANETFIAAFQKEQPACPWKAWRDTNAVHMAADHYFEYWNKYYG